MIPSKVIVFSCESLFDKFTLRLNLYGRKFVVDYNNTLHCVFVNGLYDENDICTIILRQFFLTLSFYSISLFSICYFCPKR